MHTQHGGGGCISAVKVSATDNDPDDKASPGTFKALFTDSKGGNVAWGDNDDNDETATIFETEEQDISMNIR